jgi:peptidyl-tRNA hydrolase, PTH1 family
MCAADSNNNVGIRMIVGLGNPPLPEYIDTRHNIGAIFVTGLAAIFTTSMSQNNKFAGYCSKVKVNGYDIILLNPTTYMNRSGRAVISAMNFYKLLPSQLLVVHDELDFAAGVVKLKYSGGNGGHNGLKDIDQHLGHDYWRLRIGIGKPQHKSAVVSYVLNAPTADERLTIARSCERVHMIINDILDGNFAAAMKMLHSS